MAKSAHSAAEDEFPSGTTTLSVKRGRCALPKEVVERWKLGTQPGDDILKAELTAEGGIRLHRRAVVEERIERLKAQAHAEASTRERERRLRAINDRFRDVRFSAGDGNRLSLPAPVVLALTGSEVVEPTTVKGRRAGVKFKLYVELAFDAVDLLPNDARLERQDFEEED